MKKVGILGGLGPQSTELFYNEVTRLCQLRTKVEYPSMLINSVDLWKFMKLLQNKKKLVNFIENELLKIDDKVDFIASPCNTIHWITPEIRKMTSTPFIAIHEEVVLEIVKLNVKKVGILSTKTTVGAHFYQDELRKYHVGFETLSVADEEKLDSLIWNKMLHGKDLESMRVLLKKYVAQFKRRGCDGVILACTELPLFISQKDVDVCLFSSTHILAKAVVERVFGK